MSEHNDYTSIGKLNKPDLMTKKTSKTPRAACSIAEHAASAATYAELSAGAAFPVIGMVAGRNGSGFRHVLALLGLSIIFGARTMIDL